ncbi:MAG: sensor histidine kinase [Leptospirales bacterium]
MRLFQTIRLRGKAFLFSAALLAVILLSNMYAIFSLYHIHLVFLKLQEQTVTGLLSVSRLQHEVASALPDEKRYLFFTPMPPPAPPRVLKDLTRIRETIVFLPAPSPKAHFLEGACLTDLLEYQRIIHLELNALKSGKRDMAIKISQTRSSALLIHFASLLQELRFEFNGDLERTINETTRDQEKMMIVSVEFTAVGILLVLVLLWAFSNMVLSPVMGLIEGTRRISEGVFIDPVKVKGEDELGDLARALNEMAMKLGELSRMKSEFVTIASHELRTPLTSIRGFLSMLQRGKLGPLNEEQERGLSIVREEVDHLVELVNGLLDLGRIESGQVPLDIHEMELKTLVNRLSERHRMTSEQTGTAFRVILDPELPDRIRSDPRKVTQILENLLANAFKFTPSGEMVELQILRQDNTLEIEVRDTGIGISSESLPFLFEKFYQVAPFNNRTREGLGLGLAITRGIILTMGGSISVRPNLPKGTVFQIVLPFEPIPIDGQDQEETE